MNQKIPSEQQWKYLQVLYTEILQEIDRHFSALQVNYMPIKGAYLICCGLAQKMRFRKMDDIDILVKQDDFEKVCVYFSNLPQVTFLKHKWYFEKEFSYSLGTFKCHLEIHWLLNFPARFALPTETLFTRAIFQKQGNRLLPCHEDALLILLCHALVHISFEFRDTIFEEIKLINTQSGFSWEKFWIFSGNTGIDAFIYFIMSWYNNEADGTVTLGKRHLYVGLLSGIITVKRYNLMPNWFRRVFLEIPFILKPTTRIIIKTFLQRISCCLLKR